MSSHATPTNAELARLRELGRRRRSRSEAGRFLVEGPKLVAEVLRSSHVVADIVAADDWQATAEMTNLVETSGLTIRRIASGKIDRVATTTSPQPIVAEVELPVTSWEGISGSLSAMQSKPALLAAIDLNDPGNLGTIARSAVASGFDAIVAIGDTADPFGPKAVRASAGAIFHVPVTIDRHVDDAMRKLAALGLRRVGTRMHDATPCDQAELVGPLALVVGNEAHGLGPAVEALIDDWVAIPMAGPTESMNVAMAATVLSYEVARQRRTRE